MNCPKHPASSNNDYYQYYDYECAFPFHDAKVKENLNY